MRNRSNVLQNYISIQQRLVDTEETYATLTSSARERMWRITVITVICNLDSKRTRAVGCAEVDCFGTLVTYPDAES